MGVSIFSGWPVVRTQARVCGESLNQRTQLAQRLRCQVQHTDFSVKRVIGTAELAVYLNRKS